MSASLWDWPLASADGLLTNEECSMLLDVELDDTNYDLLKTFPNAGTKIESEFQPQDESSASMYPPSPEEIKPSRAELANDILHQLETQFKQENIFSNWLEEKVELPIFDPSERILAVAPPAPAAVAVFAPPPPAPLTEDLLREFETVYGAVELTHLTPPQSPPGPATQLLLEYAASAGWAEAPADVDALLRDRAAQLASPPPSTSSASPPSSPRSSADEDWPRAKPYARADDRRSRKKEQNKNAATRYRQKKKAEVEVLLSEESELRTRHSELDSKCSDLQREIRYLKGLMRDLFKAKGLIK